MNKKITIVIVLVLIFVLIPLTVYLVKKRQELRSRAAPATVLSVSPAVVTKKVGDTFQINVQVTTGDNQVVGTDLYLSFNSLVLEALTIVPGGFLDNPQELKKTINNQTGKIIYSLASFTAKQGTGNLASINFTAKDKGTSSFAFDSGTSIAGIGETEALQNTLPGSITITASGASPTPNPAPSPSPTPTPGATATPTPTPTGSARPGATPTIPPTATSSPTPGGQGGPANPTPTPTPSLLQISTTINYPTAGLTVTAAKPTFSGKTIPRAVVKITINSPLLTATVTADAAGNWSYTATASLPNGSHTVTIEAKDPTTSQTVTKSNSFTISTGQKAATSASEVVAGNSMPTIFLLVAGLFLFVLSLVPKIL
ncbi:MAG: Ig-like domain-containing protein [Patescibacteria group bacterium]|nr:Ig-like domain-containing protein [Patescibacteria group bacterium]